MTADAAELSRSFFAAYGREEYRRALAAAEELVRLEPREGQYVFWAACVESLLDPAAGLARLRAGLDNGHWWAPSVLRGDPDLEASRRLDGFDAVLEEGERRMAAARAGAEPALRVVSPEGEPSGVVLLALHGRIGRAEEALEAWRPAAGSGAVVAALGSSQLLASGSAGWDDLDLARRELDWAQGRLPAGRLVLAGFSQGGILAVAEALRGRADAFVALAPSVGRVGMPALDELRPLLGRDGLRGVIAIGADDLRLAETRALAAAVEEAGTPLLLEVVDGLDHAYPADLAERLPRLLAFVLGR